MKAILYRKKEGNEQKKEDGSKTILERLNQERQEKQEKQEAVSATKEDIAATPARKEAEPLPAYFTDEEFEITLHGMKRPELHIFRYFILAAIVGVMIYFLWSFASGGTVESVLSDLIKTFQ